MLSDFLSNLLLTGPVQMSLTPFSRWENLGSRAYITQSKSPSHPQAVSNLNPGILTLNPVFFVPHSSCSQATKVHSLLPIQTHKQSLLFICVLQLRTCGQWSYNGWKVTHVLFNFISEHNWDRGWFRPNLKPITKTKHILSVVTIKIGLKTASPFRSPFTSTTRIYH